MAFLMTDVAKGSDATMTLMQNMGAAPLAEEEGKAQAEQVIANAQKTKLSNLVAESNFKASENSRAKLAALQQDPKFQAALAEQDYGTVLRMSGATQMLASDVENGAKTISAAETFDAKKIATEQKRLDVEAQQIGNAYGVISAVPDDKIDEFVNRMPEESRKLLIDKVGADNWAAMTGVEKKEASKNLMLNAKGQMAVQIKQIELQKQELINQSRERIAAAHDAARLSGRAIGGERMIDWARFQSKRNDIIKDGKTELKKLDEAVDAAEVAQQKSKIRSWWSDRSEPTEEASAAYRAAVAKRNEFKRKQIQKEIDLTLEAPKFSGRDIVLDNLKNSLILLGAPSDEEDDVDTSNKGKGSGSTATKESPAVTTKGNAAKTGATDNTSVESILKAQGVAYEPTKYEYKVLSDGSVAARPKSVSPKSEPTTNKSSGAQIKPGEVLKEGSPLTNTIIPAVKGAASTASSAASGFVDDTQVKYLKQRIKDNTLTPADKVRAKQLGLI